VRSGDRIRLSVKERRLDVLVSDRELENRRSQAAGPPLPARGYARLYAQSVLGAELGCDFDFLRKA
jgi:dihydroxy-acid dehydratase